MATTTKLSLAMICLLLDAALKTKAKDAVSNS